AAGRAVPGGHRGRALAGPLAPSRAPRVRSAGRADSLHPAKRREHLLLYPTTPDATLIKFALRAKEVAEEVGNRAPGLDGQGRDRAIQPQRLGEALLLHEISRPHL